MISYILDILKAIGNFIISIIQLIIDTITGVIQLLLMLPEYITYLSNLIGILPNWLSVFCLGIVAIMVIWAIRKAI